MTVCRALTVCMAVTTDSLYGLGTDRFWWTDVGFYSLYGDGMTVSMGWTDSRYGVDCQSLWGWNDSLYGLTDSRYGVN